MSSLSPPPPPLRTHPNHRVTFSNPLTTLLQPNPNHDPSDSQTPQRPFLILTSHSHSPPLSPPPDLKFDVRSLPNPPKNVRDAYDGTSKRLREWLVKDAEGDFVKRLEGIKAGIEARMKELGEEANERNDDGDRDDGGVVSKQEEEVSVENGVDTETREKKSKGDEETKNTDGGEQEEEQTITLSVGIFCEMGRHRSVAMVEELARLKWPGWDVDVVHRDVNKKKNKRESGKIKQKKTHGRGRIDGIFPE